MWSRGGGGGGDGGRRVAAAAADARGASDARGCCVASSTRKRRGGARAGRARSRVWASGGAGRVRGVGVGGGRGGRRVGQLPGRVGRAGDVPVVPVGGFEVAVREFEPGGGAGPAAIHARRAVPPYACSCGQPARDTRERGSPGPCAAAGAACTGGEPLLRGPGVPRVCRAALPASQGAGPRGGRARRAQGRTQVLQGRRRRQGRGGGFQGVGTPRAPRGRPRGEVHARSASP